MAHDYQTDRFAGIRKALDEFEKEEKLPYALLIDDGGGLHISENCEGLEQMFELLCLFSVWVISEIVEKKGRALAISAVDRLWKGLDSLIKDPADA